MQRARELDPLSLIIQVDNGVFLYFSRQYDRAIAQFRAVLDLDPDFPRAHIISYAYVQQGRFADALADIKSWRRIDTNYFVESEEAYVYGCQGQLEQARRALEKLQMLDHHQAIDPFIFVGPYIGLGYKDGAFVWLDKSVTAHSPGVTALKVDPLYDPLRADPRFQQLLRRVGLAQ